MASNARPNSARRTPLRYPKTGATSLRQVSRPLYSQFAWAYDTVVPCPGGLTPADAARLLAGRRTIVDAGCGTGRHSAELSASGFQVTGLDSSPELIAVARER